MHIFHSSLGGGKDRRFLSLEYYEHPSRAPALAKPALRSAGSLHPAWVRDGAKGGPRQEWLAAMAAVGQREFGQWGARSQFQPQRRAATAANASAASVAPLHYLDTTELARQIRSGEVTSTGVVEALLHRIRGDRPRIFPDALESLHRLRLMECCCWPQSTIRSLQLWSRSTPNPRCCVLLKPTLRPRVERAGARCTAYPSPRKRCSTRRACAAHEARSCSRRACQIRTRRPWRDSRTPARFSLAKPTVRGLGRVTVATTPMD